MRKSCVVEFFKPPFGDIEVAYALHIYMYLVGKRLINVLKAIIKIFC